MEFDELEEEYKKKLEVRDLLPSIKEELNELEKQDTVKHYIELKTIYDENACMENKKDKEILKEIVRDKKINFNLSNYYIRYGRDLNATMTKEGVYILLPENHKSKFLKPPIKVAIYRNFENPNETIIIPMKDMEKFEKEHIVTTMNYENFEEEFQYFRTNVIYDELNTRKERQLYKS